MIKTVTIIAYFISLFFIMFWLLVFIDKGARDERKKLRKFPYVSVCIPAYNEADNVRETIESVLLLDYPEEKIEVLVVDDGSRDETSKIVKEVIRENPERNIKLIVQKNKGKGAAMNNALNSARGEYFISLDADSTVARDALNEILPNFKGNIAAVLPVIRVKEKKTWIQKIQHCEYSLNFFYKKLMGSLDCINVTPGPFSIYRRDVIKKLGGFDEHNLVEDLEMALKLQKNNYKIRQILTTHVETKAPSTLPAFYMQRNRWNKGSMINVTSQKYRGMLLNRKYGDFGVFHLPLILLSAFLAVALFIIFVVIMFIKPMVIRIHDLSFVQFDIFPLLEKSIRNINLIDLNYIPLFYGIVISILLFTITSYAFSYTSNGLKKNIKPLLFYLFLYPPIRGVVWIGVMSDLLRGKVQKW